MLKLLQLDTRPSANYIITRLTTQGELNIPECGITTDKTLEIEFRAGNAGNASDGAKPWAIISVHEGSMNNSAPEYMHNSIKDAKDDTRVASKWLYNFLTSLRKGTTESQPSAVNCPNLLLDALQRSLDILARYEHVHSIDGTPSIDPKEPEIQHYIPKARQ